MLRNLKVGSEFFQNFLTLQEMELFYTSRDGTFLYFRRRNFLILAEMELSYILGKVYSEPKAYLELNHGIFRTQGIFRTLSNIYDGTFCKNSYLVHFLIFQKMVLSSLSEFRKQKKKKKKNTLKKFIFKEMELSSSRLKKLFMFQERTCNIWKIKNYLYFFSNKSAKEKSFLYFSIQRSKIF